VHGNDHVQRREVQASHFKYFTHEEHYNTYIENWEWLVPPYKYKGWVDEEAIPMHFLATQQQAAAAMYT